MDFLDFLNNNSDYFWMINGKIEVNLDLDSNLSDLAEYLLFKYNIDRSNYGPIKFSLNNSDYEDLEVGLAEIGIPREILIVVDFTTYPRFSNQPCTLRNRNSHIKYLDGIKFELSLRDKLTFCLEKCFSETTRTGTSYVEILNFVLTGTDRLIEISTIKEKIEEMRDLTRSYLSRIQKILKRLFLL